MGWRRSTPPTPAWRAGGGTWPPTWPPARETGPGPDGSSRDSGRYSLRVGALATAAGTLGRAADLLEGSPERAGAELTLIETLALAGRVDEAAAAGTG